MASISAQFSDRSEYGASDTPLVRIVDRWIYVFMAAFFISIVLIGFIPDSFDKVAAVGAGKRPPFPPILHIHAMLMGTFLLLLLTQTVLAAVGKQQYHQSLGIAAFALVPAIVIAGFLLVPTTYLSLVGALHAAPLAAKADIRQLIGVVDNIMLLQIRVGLLFPLIITIGLFARKSDPAFHKRLMLLAIAPALAASFDRMAWLPTTMPQSALSTDIYVLLAVAPLFAWDLFRTRKIQKAYVVWLASYILVSVPLYIVWDSNWWHNFAPRFVGA